MQVRITLISSSPQVYVFFLELTQLVKLKEALQNTFVVNLRRVFLSFENILVFKLSSENLFVLDLWYEIPSPQQPARPQSHPYRRKASCLSLVW